MNLPGVEDKTLPGLTRLLSTWRDRLLRWLSLPALQERGRQIEVEASTTATAFEHGLGIAPAGWLVLRAEGTTAASVVETASDDKTITLLASADVSLTLWVWP